MKRITFTMNKRGLIERICADEEVELCIVSPHCPRDRVYRWSSLRAGRKHVDDEIELACGGEGPLAGAALMSVRDAPS